MNITAKANGKTFTFPDGTTPEQMGAAIDEYFSGALTQDAPAAAPVPQVDPNSLPEFRTTEGLTALFGSEAGDEHTSQGQLFRDAMAGLFTFNPEARIAGIEERFPELTVNRIGTDNAFIVNPRTGGQAVLNREGLSATDLIPFLGGAIASHPVLKGAAMLPTAGTRIAGAVAGETALDAAGQGLEIAQNPDQEFSFARNAVAGGLGGLGGLGGAYLAARGTRNAKLQSLLEGEPDARVVQYALNGQGKIVKDPFAAEVVRQGMDRGVIAAAKGSTKVDRRKMLEMVDIAERAKNNPNFGALNRPSDVVGRSFMDRFTDVHTANKSAGTRLDTVAKSLKGQSVDYSGPVNGFIEDLADLGVTFNSKMKPVFKNSDFEGSTGAENLITKLVTRMRDTRTPDAYDAHRLKRFIDEQISFGKSVEGLSGRAEAVVKNLRRNIDQQLDDTFPAYNAVNTQYSTTREALDDFQSVAGKRIDLTKQNANKAVGTLVRRVLSNAASRVELMDSMRQMQDVAEQYGGTYADDLVTQLVFADDLAKTFGTPAKTSLAGEVQKGVNAAGEAVQGNTVRSAIDAVGAWLERVRGVNDEAGFTALREFLTN